MKREDCTALECPAALTPTPRWARVTPALLLLITILANLPFLSPQMVVIHDTLAQFVHFQFFYSELFFHGEFPRWCPLLAYGIPYDYYLFSTFHPADLAIMYLGHLLRVEDAALLFKVACLLNECIFVFGLYLLSNKLFAHPGTVWIVCLGAIFTHSWTWSIAWTLTSYYLLPWVLYFLLEFLECHKPRDLWLAAILETGSLIGTIAYMAPIHLLVLVTFLVPFVWRSPKSALLFVRWRNFVHPLFLVFAGFLGLLGFMVFGLARQEVVILATGRAQESGAVPITEFLELARHPWAGKMGMLLRGDTPYADVSDYVGLLPLAMSVYALVRRRDVTFRAFAAAAFVLLWFNVGGWFTMATYYGFPLMNRYRYLSHVLNCFRFLLLILGGFGLDQLYKDLAGKKEEPPPASKDSKSAGASSGRTWVVCLLILALLDFLFHLKAEDVSAFWIEGYDQSFASSRWAWPVWLGRALLYAILASLICRQLRGPRPARSWLAWLIPAVYLADVGCYFGLVVGHAPFCPPEIDVGRTLDVSPMRFAQQRSAFFFNPRQGISLAGVPEHGREVLAVYIAPRGIPFNIYSTLGLIMRIEPYWPLLRLDVVAPAVKTMVEARGGSVPGEPAMKLPPNDAGFLEMVKTKLAIARKVDFADDETDAVRRFMELPDPRQTLVLLAAPGSAGPRAANGDDILPGNDVVLTANREEFKVMAGSPAWLLCADAFHPGWRARVNGKPVEVARANIGFRAIPIGSGSNDVTLYFDDGWHDWLRRGFLVSAGVLGFLLLASMVVVPCRSWLRRSTSLSQDELAASPTHRQNS